MLDAGGDKVGGGEDLVILFGVPAAFGSVDDLFGFFVPMNFFQGEWSAKHVLTRSARPSGNLPGCLSPCGRFNKSSACVTIKWQCG